MNTDVAHLIKDKFYLLFLVKVGILVKFKDSHVALSCRFSKLLHVGACV